MSTDLERALGDLDGRLTGLSLTGLEVFRDLMAEAADDPKMASITLTLREVVQMCETCLASVKPRV